MPKAAVLRLRCIVALAPRRGTWLCSSFDGHDSALQLGGCGVNRLGKREGLVTDRNGLQFAGIRFHPAAQSAVARRLTYLAQMDIDASDGLLKAIQ